MLNHRNEDESEHNQSSKYPRRVNKVRDRLLNSLIQDARAVAFLSRPAIYAEGEGRESRLRASVQVEGGGCACGVWRKRHLQTAAFRKHHWGDGICSGTNTTATWTFTLGLIDNDFLACLDNDDMTTWRSRRPK